MADYFVSNSGSNTSPYDTWAKAATSLQTALTAASTNGDRVIIQYNAVPSGDAEIAANVTYTIGANISIISASNDGGSSWTPTPMNFDYWIGNSTAAKNITIIGAYAVLLNGITFLGRGNTNVIFLLGNSDGQHYEYENVCFETSTGTGSHIAFGGTGNGFNGYAKLTNCRFKFNHANGQIRHLAQLEIFGGGIESTSTVPTTLFSPSYSAKTGDTIISGFDMTVCSGSNLIAASSGGAFKYNFDDCKLPSTYTVFAAQPYTNKASGCALFSNCAVGDTHLNFEYADQFGTLSAVTTPYLNDGAKYDGTNPVCWKIVTTANPSFATPFVTPWIEKYHSGTSAITPYLEILRNDSTAPFKNDEVWGEFSAQATAGSVLPVFKNDRRALNATGANQDVGAGLASWTGESGSAWSGKIDAGSSVTPAEIGMLRARVYVGAPNTTVYVDPFIRT